MTPVRSGGPLLYALLLVAASASPAQGFGKFRRRKAPSPYIKLLARGAKKMKSGDLNGAVRLFGEAIALKPGDGRAYYQRGVCLARQRKTAAAERDYRAAIQRNPKLTQAQNNLGALLTEQGKAKLAVGYLQIAVKQKPRYAEAWFNLGLALSELRRYRAAADAYRKAVKLSPRDVDVRINLGATLQRLKDLDGALKHLGKAVALRPRDALARCGYGELLAAKGRYAEARKQLETTTRIKPTYVRGWRSLARVWVAQKNYKAALAALRRGQKRLPREPALRAAVGVVYRRWGKPQEAIAAYRRALAIDGTYVRAHLLIGLAEAARGRCKAAEKAFRRFVAGRPGLGSEAMKKLMRRCKGK
ncbi:MAG: hypothetical protein CSA65_09155 [Proteobacteria bacterium]|nr:MAG: hypothetical protein CSA65_09155 [Pseudomonadota bacterium]